MALHARDPRDDDNLKPGMMPDPAARHAQRETLVLHTPTSAITERRAVTNDYAGDRPDYDDVPDVPRSSLATSRTVVRDVVAERQRRISQINQVIWFIVGLAEVLLAMRLGLMLLGANQAAGFTQMVYAISAPLMAPFTEIFPAAAIGNFAFEPATVVAMLVYFLVGLGITRLVWILNGEPRTTR